MLKFSGWPVTEEQLEDVAKYSEVLQTGSDFLEEDFRKAYEDIIPFPERVEPTECMDAFVYLRWPAAISGNGGALF